MNCWIVRDAKDLDERVLKKNFNHIGRYWGCDKKFHLMIQKVVYPYEYMDSWKKFEIGKATIKECILQKLIMKGISDNDYDPRS